jgi:hypothetical protein
MKGKQINILMGFLLLVVAGQGACYPGGPTTADERDIVVTVFDQNKNFGAIRTYAMPDFVLRREGSLEIPRSADELILSAVARNMSQVGYVREDNVEQNGADIVVLVTVNRSENFVAWTNYPWWGGWGGWGGWGWWGGWGPGWGVGYPTVSVGSYEVGSVFIEMFDANNRDVQNQTVPVVWGAGLNGLLGGSGANAQFINDTIDQAFRQSPYLGAQ